MELRHPQAIAGNSCLADWWLWGRVAASGQGKGLGQVGGAWTVRWGQHLWEASIAAGRASNASGSCSPERFRLVFSEVYFYGETSGESGENGAGPFLLFPCLDEPSFLRERKVSRGDGRRPGPSQCAIVGCSQLAARRGNAAVPVLICRQGSHFCPCREREAGPKAVQNARLFRGAPAWHLPRPPH